MESLGKSIAYKENSVCKSMGIKKHGFHVAQHNYCAMCSVCVCLCLCVRGGVPCGNERLANKVEIRL